MTRPGTGSRDVPPDRAAVLLLLLAIVQGIALVRVSWRLFATARGQRIPVTPQTEAMRGLVSVIVPVLNEGERLAPCLAGLRAQGDAVAEILVVDGGSTDATRQVFDQAAGRDPRLRWIDAPPVPVGWNGKAWNLETGRQHSAPSTRWVLTIDADVRPEANLVSSLLATAKSGGLQAITVATPQQLADTGDAILHPALLATLVVRYGIPGSIPSRPEEVQANGQCFLIDRAALEEVGGFAGGRRSLIEDVTLGRDLVRNGARLLFAEPEAAGTLLQVAMYASWRETWQGWTRSLPMRDATSGPGWWSRMADMTLVQGMPLPAMLLLNRGSGGSAGGRFLRSVNLAALAMRLGLLIGMRRAYRQPPPTYWLSPLLDPAVVARLWAQALRRDHVWRGRPITRE